MHWTQTPEGREKMVKAQKKAWRTKRNKSRAEQVIKKAVVKKPKEQPFSLFFHDWRIELTTNRVVLEKQ